MNAPRIAATDEARRRALEIVNVLLEEAKAGRMPDLAGALGELRRVDPALQRRIAKAMVRSRGDLAALRAAIGEAPPGGSARLEAPTPPSAEPTRQAARKRVPARPPTVVDDRGRVPWAVVAVAAVAGALAAVVIASSTP